MCSTDFYYNGNGWKFLPRRVCHQPSQPLKRPTCPLPGQAAAVSIGQDTGLSSRAAAYPTAQAPRKGDTFLGNRTWGKGEKLINSSHPRAPALESEPSETPSSQPNQSKTSSK